MKRIKKIERHTVIYTDFFEVSDEEFISKFGSWDNFINSEESDEYKVNSRKELSIEKDDIAIVFVGRLSFHAKAHHVPMYTALEACAKELQGNRKIHLIQTGWFANDTIANTFKTEALYGCLQRLLPTITLGNSSTGSLA